MRSVPRNTQWSCHRLGTKYALVVGGYGVDGKYYGATIMFNTREELPGIVAEASEDIAGIHDYIEKNHVQTIER